jgi:hypothetical protein
MMMHAWIPRSLRPIRLSDEALAPAARARKYLLPALALVILLAAGLLTWTGPDSAANPNLQQAVSSVLADSSSTSGRLVRARLTPWNELNVEFTVRDDGDVRANRTAAMEDALAIAHAVYESPEPLPISVTVLGVVPSASSVSSSVPVLYASFPADRLLGLDWAAVEPGDLSTRRGVRWLPSGVCQAWHDCAVARP